MGLQENQSKTQLTAATPAGLWALRRRLRKTPALQQCVSATAFILGSSASNSSSPTAIRFKPCVQKSRRDSHSSTSHSKRARLLPVSRSLKMATAKAAYGWVAHSPSMKYIKTFTQALKACSCAFCMLTRAHLDLGAAVGRRQVMIWCKKGAKSDSFAEPFSSIGSQLVVRPRLVFAAAALASSIDLGITPQQASTADGYHAIIHKLRESWRLMSHLSSKRKEGCMTLQAHTIQTRPVQFHSQHHPKDWRYP